MTSFYLAPTYSDFSFTEVFIQAAQHKSIENEGLIGFVLKKIASTLLELGCRLTLIAILTHSLDLRGLPGLRSAVQKEDRSLECSSQRSGRHRGRQDRLGCWESLEGR